MAALQETEHQEVAKVTDNSLQVVLGRQAAEAKVDREASSQEAGLVVRLEALRVDRPVVEAKGRGQTLGAPTWARREASSQRRGETCS